MCIFTTYFSDSIKRCFTHRFSKPIVNIWSRIVGNGEIFISPKYSYQKIISLFSQVLQKERYMHIFTTYFSDSIKLCFTHCFAKPIVHSWRGILGNWERFISPTYLSTITSFTFYIYISYWEIQRYHWTPSLRNCWSIMHKVRKQLVTWMPHHQLRVGSNSNSPLFHHLSIKNSAK